MTLITHNPDRYKSRFNSTSGWMKILPRGDRKMQIPEFIEVQEMLNYQSQSSFSYLYSLYTITRGLKLVLVEQGKDENKFILFGGQIYLETERGAFFLDIDSTNLTLPNTGRVRVGVLVDFVEEIDNDELRDPITGGEVFGTPGAARLLVQYTIVINKDSFPIAVVQNKTRTTLPDIYYYRNQELTQDHQDSVTSKKISRLISRRWYEEIGDFVSRGLEVNFNDKDKRLIIHPGVAYIKGERIRLAYNKSIEIDLYSDTEILNRYLVLLNKLGEVYTVKERDIQEYSLETPKESIALATLDLYKEIVADFGYTVRKFSIIPSRNRILTVADALLVEEEHRKNEKELLQLSLDRQTLDEAYQREVNLSGVLTDTFRNFDKSDIYNPIFSASLMPSISAIRSPFITKVKRSENLIINSNSNVTIVNKNGDPYYLVTAFSSNSYISQPVTTSWVVLNTNIRNSGVAVLSPNTGTSSREDNTVGLIASSQLATLQSSALSNLVSSTTTDDLNLRLTLQAQLISLECNGFNPNEDNLNLLFGNVRISQFSLENGTQAGSTFGTIKAKNDGTVNIKFYVPGILTPQDYIVSLSNNRVTATTVYKVINIPQQRAEIDRRIRLRVNPSEHRYTGVLEGIAQTFFVESPIIIPSVKLKFRSGPRSTEAKYALISIVKVNLGIPTTDCIGIANLYASSINASNDGSAWTEAIFDKPVFISSRGSYAIVVTPLNTGGELFFAEVGRTNLITGNPSTQQHLLNGDLLYKLNDVWQIQSGKDLSFELTKAVPSTLSSEVIYKIEDTETFNAVEVNIPCVGSNNTAVEIQYREDTNSTWKLVNKNSFQLQTSSTEAYIKIKLNGTRELFPLVELDNLNILTLKNSNRGSWVSKTIQNENNYNACDITFECYKPDGTTIRPRISSNAGYSWEDLTIVSSDIVDGNIPLYRVTYRVNNLSDTVTLDGSNRVLRTRLTLRIDFSTTNSSVIPFVRRVASIVY